MENHHPEKESIDDDGDVTGSNDHGRLPAIRIGKGRYNLGNDLVMQHGAYEGTLAKPDGDIHFRSTKSHIEGRLDAYSS